MVAGLLRRLWITPPAGYSLRSLAAMCAQWTDEFSKQIATAPDVIYPGLAREGMALFRTRRPLPVRRCLWSSTCTRGTSWPPGESRAWSSTRGRTRTAFSPSTALSTCSRRGGSAAYRRPMRVAAQSAQRRQMKTPGVPPSSCTAVAGRVRPQQPHSRHAAVPVGWRRPGSLTAAPRAAAPPSAPRPARSPCGVPGRRGRPGRPDRRTDPAR